MKGRNRFIDNTEKGMYSYLERPIFEVALNVPPYTNKWVDMGGKP